MLRSVIEKISNDFINEAVSSPKLLADMAAMEKYMAESYSGRVFIELLQNADDCGSKNIYIKGIAGDIIFANDGHPFNEQDVLSISRSGASSKERGKNIGYRGVGFKSTTYLTDEIIIYSDNTYFTFSKKFCADILNVSIDEVPMIRIPILIEEVPKKISDCIDNLKRDGFQTVFIFRKAKIQEFLQEMEEVNTGYFIFLNNIDKCFIEMEEVSKQFLLERSERLGGQIVSFLNEEKSTWYILKKNNVAIGLKYDKEQNTIVPCTDNEGVYHSYLPTFDKVAYPVKINADFSTDPSRKHITIDEKTGEAIYCVAQLFTVIICKALNGQLSKMFKNIFKIFNSNASFSRCNSLLKQGIKQCISEECIIKVQKGNEVRLCEYKLLPEWFEEAEKIYLREHSEYIREESLPFEVYGTYDEVDSFIRQYSQEQFSDDDIIEVMKEQAVVEKMIPETQGKIIGKIIKSERFSQSLSKKKKDLSQIKVLTDEGVKNFNEIACSDVKISERVRETLNNNISSSEIEWFEKQTDITREQMETRKWGITNISIQLNDIEKESIKPHITKWRSAEQQCIEIETYFGNKAVDVSKKNIGYDIESITPDGKRRLIEVKSVAETGEFAITNNEYTAAHQYGEEYYLCIMFQDDKKIKVIYINNPLATVHFEKRIRQWEWVCEAYTGDSYTFEL